MNRTKKIVIVLGAILLCATLVSATILTYFGQVNTTANIQQSVLVDGQDYTQPISETIDAIGGTTLYTSHTIYNRAPICGQIKICTTGLTQGASLDYYLFPATQTINLVHKNPTNWSIIDDGITATISFDTIDPSAIHVTTTGLDDATEYGLCYYQDRTHWNGTDNWGHIFILGTFTGNINDNLDYTFGSIPQVQDDNAYFPVPDPYQYRLGAKFWIVPMSDVEGIQDQTTWNPENCLFETNLGIIVDTSAVPTFWLAPLYWTYGHYNFDHVFTIDDGQNLAILFKYHFAWAIQPTTLNIVTQFVPMD